MRRVPAKAGHQDDRDVGLDFAESLECFVAVEVGQADIDQGRRVRGLPHQRDRLVGVAGRFDAGPLAAEQVVSRPADRLVGIDDQQPRSAQPRGGHGLALLGLGHDRRAGLVYQAANFPRPIEQMTQPRDDVFVVARVAVEHGGRIGDDVVQRQRQLAVDRLDRCAGRADLLGLEQLERVERRRDVAAVDLDELAVAVVEGVRAAGSRR